MARRRRDVSVLRRALARLITTTPPKEKPTMTDTTTTDTDITRSNSLTDLAARIRTEHEATAMALKRGIQHAISAGGMLIQAKTQLKHGAWLPWLQDHCDIPERTARLYMRLAGNRDIIE